MSTFNINMFHPNEEKYNIFFDEVIETISGNTSCLEEYFPKSEIMRFFSIFNTSKMSIEDAYHVWSRGHVVPIEHGMIGKGSEVVQLVGGNEEEIEELRRNQHRIGMSPAQCHKFDIVYSMFDISPEVDIEYENKLRTIYKGDFYSLDIDKVSVLVSPAISSTPLPVSLQLFGLKIPHLPMNDMKGERKFLFVGAKRIVFRGDVGDRLMETRTPELEICNGKIKVDIEPVRGRERTVVKHGSFEFSYGYNDFNINVSLIQNAYLEFEPYEDYQIEGDELSHYSIYPYVYNYKREKYRRKYQGEYETPGSANLDVSSFSLGQRVRGDVIQDLLGGDQLMRQIACTYRSIADAYLANPDNVLYYVSLQIMSEKIRREGSYMYNVPWIVNFADVQEKGVIVHTMQGAYKDGFPFIPPENYFQKLTGYLPDKNYELDVVMTSRGLLKFVVRKGKRKIFSTVILAM